MLLFLLPLEVVDIRDRPRAFEWIDACECTARAFERIDACECTARAFERIDACECMVLLAALERELTLTGVVTGVSSYSAGSFDVASEFLLDDLSV